MDGKKVVKFQMADKVEFNTKTLESCNAYLKLVRLCAQKK
jgi:hypothetical protein